MKNLIDRIFPVKYDFYKMLEKQAEINSLGMTALYQWLSSENALQAEALVKYVDEADVVRMEMEKNLVEAFSTPFDRADIYSISVGMDKVIEYAKSTLLSMQGYEVKANDTIIKLVWQLKVGTDLFSNSIALLKENPNAAEKDIPKIRETHLSIEKIYREAMAIVFKSEDPMNALKQREVYHHIKDASSHLDDAVDSLHRIVVRII